MEDPRDIKIRKLEAKISELKAIIAELTEKIAKLTKNSSNSSKPPSSDIVSPPKSPDKRKKRKQGAQKGHKRNLRPAFEPEQIDEIVKTALDKCPSCGGVLTPTDKPAKVHQQIELALNPFRVTEYRQKCYWCEHCGTYHYAPLPEETIPGLFGPKMKTLTAWMKGCGHLSFTTLRRFISAMFHIDVSTGYLAKIVCEVSDSMKLPYDELTTAIQNEEHVHLDETGSKENGKKRWIWAGRATTFTVFKVDPSRGSEVLTELLGKEFSGIISCDFFGAYKKFAKMAPCQLQFCWAHIIREFRFLAENENRKVANYGKRIVRKIQEMFSMIHLRDSMTEMKWKRRMNIQKKKLLKSLQWGVPDDKDASNLVKRLQKYEEEYFRFIHHPIPPTNNPAEQTIRKVVLDRKVTQGTRSDWGNRWLERFWSIQTTCEQQGRNLLDYMTQTLVHYLHGTAAPSPIYS